MIRSGHSSLVKTSQEPVGFNNSTHVRFFSKIAGGRLFLDQVYGEMHNGKELATILYITYEGNHGKPMLNLSCHHPRERNKLLIFLIRVSNQEKKNSDTKT